MLDRPKTGCKLPHAQKGMPQPQRSCKETNKNTGFLGASKVTNIMVPHSLYTYTKVLSMCDIYIYIYMYIYIYIHTLAHTYITYWLLRYYPVATV